MVKRDKTHNMLSHHCEIISRSACTLDVLSAHQLLPSIRSQVGSVVRQPMNRVGHWNIRIPIRFGVSIGMHNAIPGPYCGSRRHLRNIHLLRVSEAVRVISWSTPGQEKRNEEATSWESWHLACRAVQFCRRSSERRMAEPPAWLGRESRSGGAAQLPHPLRWIVWSSRRRELLQLTSLQAYMALSAADVESRPCIFDKRLARR